MTPTLFLLAHGLHAELAEVGHDDRSRLIAIGAHDVELRPAYHGLWAMMSCDGDRHEVSLGGRQRRRRRRRKREGERSVSA